MTEALDAMVKAMDAEIDRQGAELDLGAGLFEVAHLDLEKVARAGLAAIRVQSGDFALAATEDFDIYWSYQADGRPGGPEDVFAAMIDKILEAKP